jgi:outer membrane protein OmpA-like peptidoglycan-associated protein
LGVNYRFCNGKSEETEATAAAREEAVPAKLVEAEPAKLEPAKPEPTTAEEAEEEVTVEMESLAGHKQVVTNFNSGKHELKTVHKEAIQELAERIKSSKYEKVIVTGHTDSTGTDGINEPLSKRRAEKVYKELVAAGVPQDKIEVSWHAARNPAASNKTKAGRAQNRRAEVTVQ